jgi:predicted transcriptional regulator
LTPARPTPILTGIEIHLSPEKQARLQQVATRTGRNLAQVVEEAIDRMVDYEERFIAAVEEGRVSARRGDLLEHEDVVERIEQMFPS